LRGSARWEWPAANEAGCEEPNQLSSTAVLTAVTYGGSGDENGENFW